MKLFIIIAWLLAATINGLETSNQTVYLRKALKCDLKACKLPDCRCSGMSLLSADFEGREEEIPQFVTVTFDDAVTTLNFPQYEALFADLVNTDRCKARGTFFVTHEYTDYSKVHALAMAGHEIALHSVTHGTGTEYWTQANVTTLIREFGDQINMLGKYAYIPRQDIRGLRMPFLQLNGNNSFVVAKHLGLQYDASWPTQQYQDPAMWPYTLDYQSVQDCQIGRCPQASIPGFWVSPMVSWRDTKGYDCAMLDGCIYPPAGNNETLLVSWMLENFNRHYEHNRAPFGIYLHSAWFSRGAQHFNALRRFLQIINKMPNVYLTTMSKVIEYMRNPVLGATNMQCAKAITLSTCRPRTCVLRKKPYDELRYMTVCGRCPSSYPWLGNPLGKFIN